MIFLAATLAIAQPLPAAPPSHQPAHFDAVEQCGPHGVNEWDTYYAPDGRLHIDVWCLGDDGEADYADFIRLFCDDSLYSVIADDRSGLSSEEVMAERAQICSPANRP